MIYSSNFNLDPCMNLVKSMSEVLASGITNYDFYVDF